MNFLGITIARTSRISALEAKAALADAFLPYIKARFAHAPRRGHWRKVSETYRALLRGHGNRGNEETNDT